MNGGTPKNAALGTTLAFHYQVLVGLEKCFELKEGQSIWFEKDGDVSLISQNPSTSTQIEVKEYTNPLTDHHENLWKTLKNWLDPAFDHNQYGSLVLHTTQSFGVTTRLKSWNTKTSVERLDILKKIFSERTQEKLDLERPVGVIKYQIFVMSHKDEILEELVKKVTLCTQADENYAVEQRLLSKPVGIPKNNLCSYFHALIGFVYSQADKNTWTINYREFSAKYEELTSLLCKREFTFPFFEGYEPTNNEIEKYNQSPFVQKIVDIEHHEMISDAVGHWLELQNSLLEQLDEYPLYKKKTEIYQKKLISRFRVAHSSASLNATDVIKSSKLLYNNTIIEQPLNMDTLTPPIEYRNGLLHDAMDNEKLNLKWKVEP